MKILGAQRFDPVEVALLMPEVVRVWGHPVMREEQLGPMVIAIMEAMITCTEKGGGNIQ